MVLVVLISNAASVPLLLLAGLFGVVAILAFYYFLVGLAVAAIFIRATLALFPIGLVTAALVVFVLQWDWLGDVERRAVASAIVVAAGWVVAFVTGEWRRVSTEQERRRDMVRAAITEIELISTHGRKVDWDTRIKDIEDQYAAAPDYKAFIFYGHTYGTLRRLVEQVEILEWDQIRPVMDLFQLLDRLDRIQDRIDSDQFRDLPSSRRCEGLKRYLTLQSQVSTIADAAVDALRKGPFQGWLKSLK